jgi:iron complex outermembrane receptor protein
MKSIDRFTLFKQIFWVLLAYSLIYFSGAASGQEDKKASEDEFTLEEIVVTAEFREKALQDTPLAITAYSAESMEMRNQTSIEQLTMQAPNVSLRPGNAGYGSALTAFVRGVGQVDFNPSVEEGVGIYVDDVYYATITGNILDLLDLERLKFYADPRVLWQSKCTWWRY